MFTLPSLFPDLPLKASTSPLAWDDLPQIPESRTLQAALSLHGFDDPKLEQWTQKLAEADPDHTHLRRSIALLTGLSCFVDQVDETWLLCLQAPKGRALQTHILHAQADAVLQNDTQDTLVLPSFKPPQALCVHDDLGIGLLLQCVDGALQCTPIARTQPQQVRSQNLNASVLFEALPTLRSTDPQLGNWVEEKIQQGDDWSTAVAAGMIARLPHPPKGAAARQLLQSLLQGTPPPPASWQLFVQSWTDPQIRWIQALFQTKLASLAEEIDRLMLAGFDEDTDESETSNHDALVDLQDPHTLDPTALASAASVHEDDAGSPLSSSDALDLLLRRDELASVSLLLRARESFSEFSQPLDLLDQTGSAWVHSLDMTSDISQHPMLQRILQHDPSAWWAYPVATRILPDISALLPQKQITIPSVTRSARTPKKHPKQTTPLTPSPLLLDPDVLTPDLARLYCIPVAAPSLTQRYLAPHARSAPPAIFSDSIAYNKSQELTLQSTPHPRLFVFESFSPKLKSSEIMRLFFAKQMLYEGPPQERLLLDCSSWQIDSAGSLNLDIFCNALRVEWSTS